MFNQFEYTDTRDLSPEIKPLLEDIRRLQNNNKYDEAIEKSKQVLKTNPESAEVRVILGDLYYEKHSNVFQASHTVDDAITQYQFALEMRTSSPITHYKLGNALLLKGDFDKSLSHFKTSIKIDPEFAKAYTMMGVIESKRDNLAEATYFFEKAISINPFKATKARIHMFLINRQKAHRTKKRSGPNFQIKAVKQILLAVLLFAFDKETIREVKNHIVNFYKLMPAIVKGHYYERVGFIDKAIDVYTEAIEIAVGFTPLYISLGDAYRSMNRYEDAVNEYRMAIWLNPSSISAYKNLCTVFEEMGDYDSAIKSYKKLLSFRPNDAVIYSNLANILYIKGNVSDAICAYQTAIVLNPNKTWTSVVAQTLGYVFQEAKGDYDAAISAYQSATLLNPDDVDVYVSLGSAFFDKGDLNNALAAYRSALEIDPNNAKVHCNMGYLLWGKNSLNESIASYELAIKLDPFYDIAYNNLGVIYLDDIGNFDKAKELFDKAIEINPNYALAYYNIARLMCIKSDNLEAARLFQIAIDLNSYTNELDTNEIKDRIARLFDSE